MNPTLNEEEGMNTRDQGEAAFGKVDVLSEEIQHERTLNLIKYGRHMEVVEYDDDGGMQIKDVTEEMLGLKPMTDENGWLKYEDRSH